MPPPRQKGGFTQLRLLYALAEEAVKGPWREVQGGGGSGLPVYTALSAVF